MDIIKDIKSIMFINGFTMDEQHIEIKVCKLLKGGKIAKIVFMYLGRLYMITREMKNSLSVAMEISNIMITLSNIIDRGEKYEMCK